MYKQVLHRVHIFVDNVSAIIFLNVNFVCLTQYNIVLKSRYHKSDTIPNKLCFGEGVLAIYISWFINPGKMIREKYPNCPKAHNLDTLVLIAEGKNTIQRNSGVSNVYMFLHVDFEVGQFYAARGYVNLKKWKIGNFIYQ